MNFQTLDTAFERYRTDRDTAHHLFTCCIQFAKDLAVASDDADDIAHDAAWAAWQNFNTLKPETLFSAWYLRVVKNKLRDYSRKARTRTKYEELDMIQPQRPISAAEQSSMLAQAGKERAMVEMLLAGHTLEEVADAYDVAPKTIRRRLNAAQKEYANAIN